MIPTLQEEDFKNWLLHPTTKLVMQWHQKLIDEAKEDWASRAFARNTIEETALVQAEALGKVQGLGHLLGLQGDKAYEVLMDDLHTD